MECAYFCRIGNQRLLLECPVITPLVLISRRH
jgi:hypothetical protein